MDETANKNILPIVVALIIGLFVGYFFGGGAPKPEKKEVKTEIEKTAKPESKEAKIDNARSAAPKAVSKEATILDWPKKEGAEMATLRKGTNEWTCLPDYPPSPGNDPICVDKTSMQW